MKLTRLFLIPALLFSPAAMCADTGDYDGGGGGTLPANPLAPYQVYELARSAQQDLRLVTRFEQEMLDRNRLDALEEKLYGGEKTIIDLIDSTDLEIQMEAPCRDKFGHEVDASIHASRPNAICLSAQRIAPKVVIETARKEVLALILHELSHLLGTTEAEARKYQGRAAGLLMASHQDSAAELINQTGSSLQAFSNSILNTEKAAKGSPAAYAQAARELNAAFAEVRGHNYARALNVYDQNEAGYLSVQKMRVMVFAWKVAGDSGERGSQFWREKYEQAFGGKSEVTVEELARNIDWQRKIHYPAQKVKKLTGKEDELRFLKDLFAFAAEADDHLLKITNGLSLNRVFGAALAPNPWENFLGHYEVVGVSCDKPAGTRPSVAFTVLRPDYDLAHTYLRQHTANGWGDAGAYEGAGDLWGGAAVRVNGNESFAEREAEMGTAWGENWSRRSFKLERLAAGFRMTETQYHRQQTRYGMSENSSRCVFNLRKSN